MNEFKNFIRQNFTMANIIIILLGVCGILFGGYLESSFWKSVITDLGLAFLSSGLIVLITSAFLGDSSDEELKRWGIKSIYRTRGEMNVSCGNYMKHTRKIDIIAFGLKSWRDGKNRDIENLVHKGCKIRILTMDPASEHLKQRDIEENKEVGSTAHDIYELKKWADKLNSKSKKGKVEIKFYDAQPLDFVFLMDKRLFWGPYEYGKGSQQTISFEYDSSGETYKYYNNYFDELWNNDNFAKIEV